MKRDGKKMNNDMVLRSDLYCHLLARKICYGYRL